MLNPLIDRFCDSRRRWLIVTGVTFVAGLLTVLPQVDQYFARCDEQQKLEETLVAARRAAEELPAVSVQAEAETETLAALEQRMVDKERLPVFRNSLVTLVRESGCQMRRINVGAAKSREWKHGDHPINEADKRAKPTPFTLEMRPVNLSVTGSTIEVRDLLTRIEKEQMIFHAKTMDLRPTGRNRRGVQMDLELWYFALTNEPRA